MRIGIATLSGTQANIMMELLTPMFSDVTVYDKAAIDEGRFITSNVHIMIIDYSIDSIMEEECVLDMLDKTDPISVLSERDLYPLKHDERLAWRKHIVKEIERLLPDLAHEINSSREARLGSDVWVIGSSSGGPDALLKLFTSLPKLPTSIFIAQHIASDQGSHSMQSALNSRQSNWKLEMAQDGKQLQHGHAYMVPRDTVVSLEGERMSIRPLQLPSTSASPNINANIRSIRRSAAGGMGVVILTGLGDDGSAALREIKHKTLLVLAQDADECGVSSMPDAARSAGVVDETHTASGIASRIAKHYGVGVL